MRNHNQYRPPNANLDSGCQADIVTGKMSVDTSR